MQKYLKENVGFVNTFLILINGKEKRFDGSLIDLLLWYEAVFGTEMWKHTIIEYTFWKHSYVESRTRKMNQVSLVR